MDRWYVTYRIHLVGCRALDSWHLLEQRTYFLSRRIGCLLILIKPLLHFLMIGWLLLCSASYRLHLDGFPLVSRFSFDSFVFGAAIKYIINDLTTFNIKFASSVVSIPHWRITSPLVGDESSARNLRIDRGGICSLRPRRYIFYRHE
jgi:hypothetical protein